MIQKREGEIQAIGKIFQNKANKWQVFLYFDENNKDRIGFTHRDRDVVEHLIKNVRENHCEFNVNEGGYITTYAPIMKRKEATAKDVEDTAREVEGNVEYTPKMSTEERIAISWGINAVLQYAQIHSGEVWTWDRIINEAEQLRNKVYKL